MIINFFINALRSLRKQPGYLLLNIAGFAIGLTSFIFITSYVVHELSFDRFHKNYKNIYRIKVIGRMSGGKIDQAITAAPMAQAMLKDYPEILQATRVRGYGDWLVGYEDNRFNEDGVLFADSTFFDVLSFRLLRGDPGTALVRPRSLVLTEDYALKYFGTQDPMGKKMSFEADTNLYTVTGVVQNVPDNSHIKFDMLASMSTYPGQANSTMWLSHNFFTYILVKEGTDKAALQAKLQDLITRYVGEQIQRFLGYSIDDFRKAGNDFSYVLEDLKDLHLKGATQYNPEPLGSPSTVRIFGVVAILIMIIAIVNYINLATAKSVTRAREVGVRKASGAAKSGLVIQFLGESVILTALGGVVAVLLVLALTPAFNQLLGLHVPAILFRGYGWLAGFGVLIVLTGIFAGFYPAFVLASFNPVDVLKGTLNPGSMSRRLRAALVVIQFTISILIIIGSIVIYSQLSLMTRKDLGFNKENLIVIRRVDAFFMQMAAFRDRLLQIPGVKAVGFSRAVPGTTFNNNAFLKDEDPDRNTFLLNQTQVSYDFPQTLGVQLAQGRFFSTEYSTDSTAVLINETAVKNLGLTDPVGKYLLLPAGPDQFIRIKIIGIMKDFNIESMHKEITPVIFTVLGRQGGDQFATVRLTGNDINATIKEIEKTWKTFAAKQPFQYDFFSDRWNNLYASELKTGKIFIIFSILAIFIACLGLIGMMTYITNKRTKEIGIRKSYGAESSEVLVMLSKEVFYLILISSLIAYPLAFFASRYWLQGFADRISVSPLVFFLSTLIGFCIGWISISYQAFKAANYNPANALREVK